MVQIYLTQDPGAPILRGQARIYREGGDSLGVRLTRVSGAVLFNGHTIPRRIGNPDRHPRSDPKETLSERGIYDHRNGVRFGHRAVFRAAA